MSHDHLPHVAHRVAPQPDRGSNDSRQSKTEFSPEREHTQHADSQIGDAHFILEGFTAQPMFSADVAGKKTCITNV